MNTNFTKIMETKKTTLIATMPILTNEDMRTLADLIRSEFERLKWYDQQAIDNLIHLSDACGMYALAEEIHKQRFQ